MAARPDHAGDSRSRRRSDSARAILRSGSKPLPSATRAETLLVNTDVMTPNPIVNTPIMLVTLGATIIDQLRLTFRSRSRATSLRSQSLDNPPSRKMTWAVSVAMVDAPRSEIETSAFLSAIESLIPSPTKQTVRPSACSFAT